MGLASLSLTLCVSVAAFIYSPRCRNEEENFNRLHRNHITQACPVVSRSTLRNNPCLIKCNDGALHRSTLRLLFHMGGRLHRSRTRKCARNAQSVAASVVNSTHLPPRVLSNLPGASRSISTSLDTPLTAKIRASCHLLQGTSSNAMVTRTTTGSTGTT
jgi:hypothetical protein